MPTITQVVREDHANIDTYYENIFKADTTAEKAKWQNQFVWLLTVHSLGEELVVYPLMAEKIPDGEAMAAKDRKQHQTTKEHLYTLQSMSPEDTQFEPLLKRLMSDLKVHMVEEIEEDMPALESHISPDESIQTAEQFVRSKKFVPTRSHPSAADIPPLETVAGLLMAPIDKIQDLFRSFP